MKFVIFFLMIFYTSINAQDNFESRFQLSDELSIEKIDTGVYLVRHSFPYEANNLVIKFSKNKYLFLDTPYTDEATEQVVKWFAEKDSSEPVLTVINTHFHVDNLGGNGYLTKAGAEIFGSDLTVQLLEKRGLGTGMLEAFNSPTQSKYYEYYKNKELTPPNKIFNLREGLKIVFDDDSLEVFFPGGGHTPDNVVVYYPSKKILFGGCLVKSMESNSMGFIGDAELDNWQNSLTNVLNRYFETEIVIPGHGNPGGVELILHTLEILNK